MVTRIPLTKGYAATVDVSDFGYLSQFKWCVSDHGRGKVYAVRYAGLAGKIGGKWVRKNLISMHRDILRPESWQEVDHINGDGLDNQRTNLRLCTHAQNHYNQPPPRMPKTSRYKGVCFDERRGIWRASITVTGRQHYLGQYAREIDAARAHDCAALKFFGSFARTNLPTSGTPP